MSYNNIHCMENTSKCMHVIYLSWKQQKNKNKTKKEIRNGNDEKITQRYGVIYNHMAQNKEANIFKGENSTM